MSTEDDQRIEDLYQEFQRQSGALGALQRSMKAIAVTAQSPRREVAVTVNHAGVVTGLRFPTGAYKRLAPQELADLLLATIAEARSGAADEAAVLLGPLLPAGIRARDLAAGEVDAQTLFGDQPRLHRTVVEQLREVNR